MKKNGFTLAEVLITLGVIGIIAALTLPGLNASTGRKHVGPALSKAIHNLEAANRAIIQEESVRSLEQANNDYLSLLERKLAGEIDTISLNGQDERAFIGKDNISYMVRGNLTDAQGTTRQNQGGRYWTVVIDINGQKIPNLGGSDQFMVYVDNKGEVLSAGSADASFYIKGDKESVDCHTADPDLFCTGTVERDGWEAKY